MNKFLPCLMLGTALLLVGCRGGRESRAELEVMIPLVTAQIGETLVGMPARSLSTNADPPILGVEGRTRVVLAADEAAFVQVIGQGSQPKDIYRVVERISQELNKELRRKRLSSSSSHFPPVCDEKDKAQTVLASVTPYTLETGGPQAKETGKGQTLLMARLTLTRATDGHVLASREFFSGYTLPKPRAGR
jgi:hypothetical protein